MARTRGKPGAELPGAPPDSVDEMIGAAVGDGGRDVALDDAVASLDTVREPAAPAAAPQETAGSAPSAAATPRKGGWPKGKPRRGHDPRYTAPEGAAERPSSSRAGEPRATKAELAEQLAQAQREAAELREQVAQLAQVQAAEQIGELGGLIGAGFQMFFQGMAQMRGAHWVLEDADAKKLGDAWVMVAAQHREQLAKYLPWGIALGATANVIGPRVRIDNERVKALAAEQGTSDVHS